MKIAIAGIGYVGLSNAILLAQHHEVTAVDIIEEKVEMINQRRSPLVDREIEDYLANAKLDLTATTDGVHAYENADYVIISTDQATVKLMCHGHDWYFISCTIQIRDCQHIPWIHTWITHEFNASRHVFITA